MDGTILGQGTFVANFAGLVNPIPGTASIAQANPTIIQIPSGADWVSVRNFTQYGTVGAAGAAYFNGTANADVGFNFYWQRGMAAGTGIVEYKASASGVMSADTLVSGGFTLYDPTVAIVPTNIVITGMTAANPAVVTYTPPTPVLALAPGTIVRLNNMAGAKQNIYNGMDFSIGYGTLTATTFSVDYLNSTGTTSGAGDFQVIPYDAYFYPRRRYITNIVAGALPNQAVITLSVDHGLTVGQEVRLNLPGGTAVWGAYAALSNYGFNPTSSTSPNSYKILATDTAVGVGHNTITINVSVSGFATFLSVWQAIVPPYTPAQVIPIGEDTATALSSIGVQTPLVNGIQINATQTGILADATVNTGFLGMILGSGGDGLELTTPIIGPSGSIAYTAGNVATGDVLYWLAGKSSYGGQ